MSSQEMERLEPIIAEDRESRPPCCVSTHCSRVVDICISPTFLDHREAVPVLPHITSFSRTGGHLAWSPVQYLPHTQRSGYSEEAPCRLALCTPGSPVTSRSAHVSSRLASAISFF